MVKAVIDGNVVEGHKKIEVIDGNILVDEDVRGFIIGEVDVELIEGKIVIQTEDHILIERR